MQRLETPHRSTLGELADVGEVIRSVNATLDAILAAAIPVLTVALARTEVPARVHDPREDAKSGY